MSQIAAKLRRRSKQFADEADRWGQWRAVHILVMQLLERWLGLRVARFSRRVLLSHPEIPELPPGYSVRKLTDADYHAATQDPELDLNQELVEAGLANGSLCVGAFHGEKLVAYVWRAFRDTPIQQRFSLGFQKPNRYGYKALTLPEYRGRHLQNVISLFSDQTCIDHPRCVLYRNAQLRIHTE